jgi:hypothetical protein
MLISSSTARIEPAAIRVGDELKADAVGALM